MLPPQKEDRIERQHAQNKKVLLWVQKIVFLPLILSANN